MSAGSTAVPIAELQPELAEADSCYFQGVVTLVWPYSSSSKSLSLLLVEPDFRLRARHGQVRLYFSGASAKAVSKSEVTSGDQLTLSLRGVTWAKDDSAGSTPGKGIEWQLQYGEFLDLKIRQESGTTTSVSVDHPAPSPDSSDSPYDFPPYNSHIPTSSRKHPHDYLQQPETWESPAFLKRGRFLASAYDPFAEEADFPDNDRRKRAKFGYGSGQWRFTEKTPSPIKETVHMEPRADQETPSRPPQNNLAPFAVPFSLGDRDSILPDQGNVQEERTPPAMDLDLSPIDRQDSTSKPPQEISTTPLEDDEAQPAQALPENSSTESLKEPIVPSTLDESTGAVTRPSSKPLQEPFEGPVPNSVEMNNMQAAPQPLHKLLSEAQEQPSTALVDEPTTAPVDEPTTATAEKLTIAPVEEPTAAPVEELTTALVEELTAALVEEPTAAPVDEPMTALVEEPSIALVEEPTAAPVDEPTAAPAQELTTAPVDEPTTALVEEPTIAPVDEPTTALVEEPTIAPVEELRTAPLEESNMPSASQSPHKMSSEAPEEPTATPVEEPTVASVEERNTQAADPPLHMLSVEAPEEPIAAPVEESSMQAAPQPPLELSAETPEGLIVLSEDGEGQGALQSPQGRLLEHLDGSTVAPVENDTVQAGLKATPAVSSEILDVLDSLVREKERSIKENAAPPSVDLDRLKHSSEDLDALDSPFTAPIVPSSQQQDGMPSPSTSNPPEETKMVQVPSPKSVVSIGSSPSPSISSSEQSEEPNQRVDHELNEDSHELSNELSFQLDDLGRTTTVIDGPPNFGFDGSMFSRFNSQPYDIPIDPELAIMSAAKDGYPDDAVALSGRNEYMEFLNRVSEGSRDVGNTLDGRPSANTASLRGSRQSSRGSEAIESSIVSTNSARGRFTITTSDHNMKSASPGAILTGGSQPIGQMSPPPELPPNPNVNVNGLKSKSPEEADLERTKNEAPRSSQIQIIDLESEEDEEAETEPAPQSHQSEDKVDDSRQQSQASLSDTGDHEQPVEDGSHYFREASEEAYSDRLADHDREMSMFSGDDAIVRQDSFNLISKSPNDDASKAAKDSGIVAQSVGQVTEEVLNPPWISPQVSVASAEAPEQARTLFLLSDTAGQNLDELPSTVPDSAAGASIDKLLTTEETQRASFASQPTALSLRSFEDPDTLSTPGLTQGTSAGIELPRTPMALDEDSPKTHSRPFTERKSLPTQEYASAELSVSPPQQKEKTTEPESPPTQKPALGKLNISPTSPDEKPEQLKAFRLQEPVSNRSSISPPQPTRRSARRQASATPEPASNKVIVSPQQPTKQSTERRVSPMHKHDPHPANSSPPPFSPITPLKRRSALVEKLRARRLASENTPQSRIGNASRTASPWFAPRRSSKVVPDSDADSVLSETEKTSREKTPKKAPSLLATPEKSLAQSFVRSSPAGSVASSQYVPPSQPTTGGLRTSLSYFVPLDALPQHFGTLTDTFAVAVSSTPPTRAKSGPRDFTMTLYITDYSSSKSKHPVVTAQLFRPNQKAFPQTHPGNAIMLRNFKVQSFQHQISLLSTDTSAWVVFPEGTEPQVRGPPIEFGAEERAFARGHWKWWASLTDFDKGLLLNAVPKETPVKANGKTKTKTAAIDGTGVDLPGSQTSKGGKKRNQHSTQALAQEWGLDEAVDDDSSDDKPVTRRRGLRPRKGRGKTASESPEKEDPPARTTKKRSKSDSGSDKDVLDGESESEITLHELRDGRKYTDMQ